MALVYIYDATELDKEQLGEVLNETDHDCKFVEEKINLENCDPEAEVISVFVTSKVTRELIEAMPKLKLIACRSTGFNNINLEATDEHGITVVNVPVYGNETVAEFAFMMLLALQRKLPAILETENRQFEPSDLTGTDLHGKVFGSIGTGNIGQKALKIASGFSMQTIAFDINPNEELQGELNFRYVSLDELLEQADVVSLHVPYLPSTHHIIGKDQLERIKPGAVLINTARGELVDSEAMIEALNSGRLGGAAIDVVEGESLLIHKNEMDILRNHVNTRGTMEHSVEISILKSMPNVIISPHNAYNTIEAIQRINKTTGQNIVDYWYGNTPNKVTPPPITPGKLLLSRHGQSEWNALGKWTGLTDIHLDNKGFGEAAKLGLALEKLDIAIDVAFYSEQIRSRETLEGMLNASQQFEVELVKSGAINERDYGEYTGKNKWEIQKQVGEEAFNAIRRGWDEPVPGGETLREVYDRAVPFYKETIVPLIHEGKNVLIVAHGNTNRALEKYIESISDEDINKVEMMFGEILVYEVDADGICKSKLVVDIETEQLKN